MQPHKHQALIIAWANGEKIQYRKPDAKEWKDCDTPAWVEDYEYRVKPKEPKRPRVADARSPARLADIYDEMWRKSGSSVAPALFANNVLQHACDNGQVVTREEFDRMCGDQKAREREIVKTAVTRWCHWSGISSDDVDIVLALVKA